MVRIIWKDASEGPLDKNLFDQVNIRLSGSIPTTTTVTTTGRFSRVMNDCIILDDVISEESNGVLIYVKQSQGKWLSIPLGVIEKVIPTGELDGPLLREARRRRTIFRQLTFIPRSKKLSNGEISRTLYVA